MIVNSFLHILSKYSLLYSFLLAVVNSFLDLAPDANNINNSRVSVEKKQPSLSSLSFISFPYTLSEANSVNFSTSYTPSIDGHLNGVYNVFNGRLNTDPLYSIGVVISDYYMIGFFVRTSI